MRINIKPISVNDVWQGKRFKTNKYKCWERDIFYLLPPTFELPERDIKLYLEFGLSTNNGDIDNPTKPTLDVLQKKYGFNDRYITELHIKKVIVAKGNEYIEVKVLK